MKKLKKQMTNTRKKKLKSDVVSENNNVNTKNKKYSLEQIQDIFVDELECKLKNNKFYFFTIRDEDQSDNVLSNMPPSLVIQSLITFLDNIKSEFPQFKEEIDDNCQKMFYLSKKIYETVDRHN